MANGWRPRGARPAAPEAPPVADEQEAPPAPPRRRTRMQRRNEADDAAHPKTVAARKALPREAIGERPPAGRKPGPEEKDTRKTYTVQLGQRWGKIVTEVKAGQYTWQEFVDGLDEEELARGQLRADDGSFVGRPPALVPREFLLACQREQKRRFEIIFGSEVLGIAEEYVKLCKSANIPEKDRAKMMQYAMERIFGGIPRDVRVSQEAPWEQMVVNVVSDGDSGMPDHHARRYAGYAERQGGGRKEETP